LGKIRPSSQASPFFGNNPGARIRFFFKKGPPFPPGLVGKMAHPFQKKTSPKIFGEFYSQGGSSSLLKELKVVQPGERGYPLLEGTGPKNFLWGVSPPKETP